MKKIFILIFLFAATVSAQLPEIIRDNFNGYSAGTDMNGQLAGKWKKLKSTGTDTVGTMVTDNQGRIFASNTAGNNHYGGLLLDTIYTNNGTDEILFGFTIPVKGASPGYQNQGWQDVYLFCMMDSSGGPTGGYIDKWSGNAVILGSWNPGSGGYSMSFANVTNGVIGTQYGGSGNGNEALVNGSTPSVNDTIWVKVIGNIISLYRTNPNAGSGLMYSQVMTQTVKSSGKFAVLARQSQTPTNGQPSTATFNDVFIGLSVQAPFDPPTVDTIAPVFLVTQASRATLDTVNPFYWTLRAVDNNTATQLNPKMKWVSIRVDSLGGAFKDSTHTDYSPPQPTDVTINTTSKQYAAGNYLVTFTAVDSSNNVSRTTIISQIGAGRRMLVFAYYDTWCMNPVGTQWWSEPPDVLNYSNGVTHLIQFTQTSFQPTWPFLTYVSPGGSFNDSMDINYGTGRPTTPVPFRDSLIAKAHRAGVKVLICMNAVNATNLIAILDQNANGVVDGADSARTDSLAQSVANWCARHGYDGADYNIEHGAGVYPSKNHIALLIRRQRVRFDGVNAGGGGKMLLTFAPESGSEVNYPVSECNAYVDMINLQTYDNQYAWNGCMGSNSGWYAANVYPPSDAQLGAFLGCYGTTRFNSIDQHGGNRWSAAGFNKSIIGIGISTYGRFRYPNTPLNPAQIGPFNGWVGGLAGGTNDNYAASAQTASQLLNNGGVLAPYDTVTKSQWIYSGPSGAVRTENIPRSYTPALGPRVGQPYYFAYVTPRNVQDVAQYISDNGFAAMMLFDYQYDNDPSNPDVTKRNPLMEAAGQAAGGYVLPLPPSSPVNQVPANGATSQAVSGLLFQWTVPSGATSYHFQISTSPSFSSLVNEFNIVNNQVTSGQFPFTSPLSNGTTYYWRVTATGTAGTSNYSTSTQFTTVVVAGSPPSTPVQVSPLDNSTQTSTTVQLVISPGNSNDIIDKLWYQVKVADSTSSSFTVNDSSTNSTSRTLSNLSPGSRYYWRVAALNTAGQSNFTFYRTFIIQINTPISRPVQSALIFDPNINSMVLGDQVQGSIEQDIPVGQWSASGVTAGKVKRYPRGLIDSAGNKTPYGSDILNQASTVSQSWNFASGLSSSAIATSSMSLNGFMQTDFIPTVNFANHGTRTNGSLANPWIVTFTNGLTLVNPSFANPNVGLNLLIPDFASSKNLYLRPYGSLTTDTVATSAQLTAAIASVTLPPSIGDSTLFKHIHLGDEYVANYSNEGVAQNAKNTQGKEVGDLRWTVWGMISLIANAVTYGQQFVNTAIWSPGIGWAYMTPTDSSSNGLSPIGAWQTLGRDGPIRYGRPTNAILRARFRIPQRDSTVAWIGWTSQQSPMALDSALVEQAGIQAGGRWSKSSSGADAETLYAVTANGTTKTQTYITRAAEGDILDLVIVYGASSISFYVGPLGTSFTGPITISTNLPAGTSGMLPVNGTWTYQMRKNSSAGIVIDAWTWDEWIAR